MTARPAAVDDPERRRLDRGIAALVGLLAAVSVVLLFEPQASPTLRAPELDVGINVLGTLVATMVGILAWVRWREAREVASLYVSSAFVALAMANALIAALPIVGAVDSGSAQVYLWTLARDAAAILLLVGAVRSLRGRGPRVNPLAVALVPALVVLIVGIELVRSGSVLPAVVGAAELVNPGIASSADRVASTILLLIQVAVFAAFIVAAVLYRRLFVRDRLVSNAFLSAGLVVAAFSQLHFAIVPVPEAGSVTAADVLRVAFNAILFLGIEAELQADLRGLRRANSELRRLRDVDAAHAALAERARLAREIHDGLAQELWRAKLKQSALEQAPELSDGSRQNAREVMSALDSALAEARQAVMAMRADPAGSTLEDVLRQYVEDFSDRFGMRASFEADARLPNLAPRTQAEVLRIVQEALNNARRHSDATLVRVRSEWRSGRLRLTVADNGRGFDPSAVGPDRYGLVGMRERASLVGASLTIDSARSDGTRVSVDVPVAGAGSEPGVVAPAADQPTTRAEAATSPDVAT
ncbi:MAG TPA: sensor histidine kinase [Candidatus Limnocylindrales bacterium]|nr:sensor histidine kinase [Candidatus Limnocylindrales bacterium]